MESETARGASHLDCLDASGEGAIVVSRGRGCRMKEDQPLAPANIYAFSKVQLDNLARIYARRHPSWRIVGLRYFNVYGPREAHKCVPASMVLHLSRQIKEGKRPRIFKHGEQKRDFVYVKDIVEGTLRSLEAKESGIYNLGSGQARSFNGGCSTSVMAEGTQITTRGRLNLLTPTRCSSRRIIRCVMLAMRGISM